jgi:hypothetical protein
MGDQVRAFVSHHHSLEEDAVTPRLAKTGESPLPSGRGMKAGPPAGGERLQ